MAKAKISFDTVLDSVLAVDVHKEKNVACLLLPIGKDKYKIEKREFNTLCSGNNALAQWAVETNASRVVMESTGPLWIPVSRTCSDHDVECYVVNAYHVKNVPGRKTDTEDSEWLAKVACCGLVNPSFTPTSLMFMLRQLSKIHTSIVKDRCCWKNRLNKTLIEAGVRLDCIASDIHGATSREMLECLLQGGTPEKAVEIAGNRLKASPELILDALKGSVDITGDVVINWHVNKVRELDAQLCEMHDVLSKAASPFDEYIKLLVTMPGVDEIAAIKILAEIGTDMSKFGSPEKISSWAGVCPGNNESAGKRKSGRSTKGNERLKYILVECAQAAVKTDCQLREKFRSLLPRCRFTKALIAIAHKMLRIIYCMISRKEHYKDNTVDFFKLLSRPHPPRWAEEAIQHMPTLWAEVLAKIAATKRPRGRPKGAGEKAKTLAEREPVATKMPRERPKGSGEKTKTLAEPEREPVATKRPRGRPKESGRKKS